MSKTIEVTGCNGCPFGVVFDIPEGVGVCRLGGCEESGFIHISNGNTPDNCPLKKESITIKIKDDEKQENIKNAN